MRIIFLLFVSLMIISCSSSNKQSFDKDKVCSNSSLKYLKNPRNQTKSFAYNAALTKEMMSTNKSMQLCYEDFRNRSGIEEFNTCLVVGVDGLGNTEYFNFSSNEVELDQEFLECASIVTRAVPYGKYGNNYMLVQAYSFYNESSVE